MTTHTHHIAKMAKRILLWTAIIFCIHMLCFSISYPDRANLHDLYGWRGLRYFLAVSLAFSCFGILHYHWAFTRFFAAKRYVAYAISCLGLYLLADAICIADYIASWTHEALSPHAWWRGITHTSSIIFIFGLPFVVLYTAKQAAQSAAKRRKEIEQASRRTSILLLQKKLEPHFLFNMLNAIYAIAQRDAAARTIQAIDTLSAKLREALETDKGVAYAPASHKGHWLRQLLYVWLGINGFMYLLSLWTYATSGVWGEDRIHAFFYQPLITAIVSLTIVGHYYWLYKPTVLKGHYRKYIVRLIPFIGLMVAIDVAVNYLALRYVFANGNDTRFSLVVMVALARVFAAEGICAWVYASVSHYRHSRRLRNEALKQQQADEHRLSQSQVDTETLFNSLAELEEAAASDAAPRTMQAVSELTNLFRYSAAHAGHIAVPVQDELQFLEQYIHLQQMRVRQDAGVRIATSITHDGSKAETAPMLLLPYIENAFKYGISYAQPSFIEISIAVANGRTECRIANSDHAALRRATPSAGRGLADTAKRLELQYAGCYSLAHGSTGGVYTVKLTISPA